jgi:hypothetical protein
VNDDKLTVALLIAVEVAFGFSAFEPSIFTIRHFSAQPETKESIRIGEVLAVGYSLLIAIIAGMITKSVLPVLFTCVSCAGMVGIYEWALNNPESAAEVMK